MAIVSGQGTALQIGKESTWGTAVSGTVALNFLSENFKIVPEYKEEDTLVGGTTSRAMDIMKKSVSWDYSMIAKPGNIGLALGLAFGAEAAVETAGTSGKKHTFTMLRPGADASLPSFTATIDRHIAVKKYTGCKTSSFGFSCTNGDYVRLSFSGTGKDEVAGSLASGVDFPTEKAFRFAGGTCTLDGTSYGAITNVSFNLNNNLDAGEQTLGSGYYGTEQQPQKREATIQLDAEYDATTEGIHEDNFKTGTAAEVVLEFISPEEVETGLPYSIKIILPAVVVTECSPVIGGTDKIRVTINGTATETIDDGDIVEAVTVELVDKTAGKYLA